MAIELFEHNQETYESIKAMMEGGDRVAVVQPTGTGKSFLFLKWIEDNAGDAFVVVSPSNEIFNQLERYAQGTGDGIILGNTEFVSYQTLNNMTDEEMSALVVDKLILDEYHRAGAAQWGPSLQRFFEVHPELKVLGATATPIRYLDEYKDMTKVLFNERLARYMSLGEAVVRGILPMPTYVQVWNENDARVRGYQERIEAVSGENEQGNLEELFSEWKRHLEMAYGPEKMFKEHMPTNHGKFIVFCSDVEHLELMKEKMISWLKDVNTNVHCYTSIARNADKDTQLEAFIKDQDKTAVKLLFSIDRFNEGLHVPELDGVVMLRPTTSPIIYLQQIGRALACGSKKTPVIFDVVNNYQNCITTLEDGGTRNIFESEIGNFMEAIKKRREGGECPFESFNIFSQAGDFVHLFGSFNDYLVPFELKWKKRVERVREFMKEFGREPGILEIVEDIDLGNWLYRQKVNYANGKLSEEWAEELRSLGVVMERKTLVPWEDSYKYLIFFVEKNGRLPEKGETVNDFNVGIWLATQKYRYKIGKLSEEQAEKLRSLGVVMVKGQVKQTIPFETWLMALKGFKLEYGRLPRNKETFNNLGVARWLSNQKSRYQKGKLSEEQAEELRSLGVVMERKTLVPWEDKYANVKAFKKEYGRLPRNKETFNGDHVGFWLYRQKVNYANGKLSEERAEMLKSIGALPSSQ